MQKALLIIMITKQRMCSLSKVFNLTVFGFNNKIRFTHKWFAPTGFDTGIKVYSRISDSKVPLILLNKNFVKWYICGPTVYDVSHIGHASCYMRFDIIRRILEQFFNIRPVIALGITDIDDKIIRRAYQLQTDWRSLSKKYECEFFQNLNDLNILQPSFVLRVSDHIPEIIEFITKIIDKGSAYRTTDGSVYFSSTTSKNYGKLNPVPTKASTSLKEGQKCYLDFALWKAQEKEPFFESPWGKGRPGWHIECSAMASKIFGSQLDLHSGGIDLIFPHHENEEAQSCSYHSCDQWVNYWLHAGQLQVENEKMSKSLNNFISIDQFLDTYSQDTLRMFCFASHYRRGLHYGSGSMEMSKNYCSKISEFLMDSQAYIRGSWVTGNVSEAVLLKELDETVKSVQDHFSNDFDTSACLNSLFNLIKTTVTMLHTEKIATVSRSPGAVAAVNRYVSELLSSCGFQFHSICSSNKAKFEDKLEYVVNTALQFRSDIRVQALSCSDKSLKGNLLKSCDIFRNELGKTGIIVKDQQKNTSSWGIQNVKEKLRGT